MDDYGIFSSQGLWRPSIFTVDSNSEDTIFEGLQLNELSGLASKHPNDNLFESLLDEFDLPPLEDIRAHADLEQDHVLPNPNAKPQAEIDESQESQTHEHDAWDLEAEPPTLAKEPRLHTWEAFQLKGDQLTNPIYLSEAGDSAFNAVYQQREQSAGVIQHDVTLRACCSLVLGRSSTLFSWDAEKMSFAPVLARVSLSGLSLTGSVSLIQQFINTGTSFRQLYIFATHFSVKDCTAMVAFRRSVGDLLDHVERHICGQLVRIRSLLQLQQVIDRPCYILEHIGSLIPKTSHARTDEALISMLSDEVTALAEGGNVLVGAMKEILVLVSMPWLQTLAEDVGLASGSHTGRASTTFEATTSTNQRGLPEAQFLMAEDIRNISSVRHSIRLLREHVPSHPLVKSDASIPEQDILHLVSRSDPENIVHEADDYQGRMSAAVIHHCKGSRSDGVLTHILDDPMEIEVTASKDHGAFALSTLEDFAVLENDTPHETSSGAQVYSRLRRDLDVILAANEEDLVSDVLQLSSDLLAPLRPFIDVQATLVNGAVMQYVFETYQLRDHLELHRSYHLFGNGDFVTRLATALFSGDVQTAERKRGNIPTSETMGLRLDSRESQRWPPASSELRLTLLNVLSESYAPSTPHEDNIQLPGGLSFAIRELTDAEIDRVMDPTSIYALDFLRLQYTPPVPIADIFTATIAQHYDSIFRTLLVHVRVLHATSQLSMFCIKQQSPSGTMRQTTIRRFAWKARQLSTTIFSHYTDTVITKAWNGFSERLDELQPRQESEHISQSVDLHTITHLHENCLDDIRSKMFLRHKHAKIRAVLEELAAIVIKTALIVVHDATDQSSVTGQESRFDLLTVELRALLEVLANKPVQEEHGDGRLRGVHSESDAAKLLLARLGW